MRFKWSDVVWLNVVIFAYLHCTAVYGAYLLLTGQAKITAFIFGKIYFIQMHIV